MLMSFIWSYNQRTDLKEYIPFSFALKTKIGIIGIFINYPSHHGADDIYDNQVTIQA